MSATAMPSAASLYNDRAPARMPLSAVGSITLHVLAIGLWLYTFKHAAEHHVVNVGAVDIITVKKNVPLPPPKTLAQAKPAVSAFDFLKMALPAVPHLAAPQQMAIKLPDEHKPMTAQAPKLRDRGRFDAGPKLNMDLDKAHDDLNAMKITSRIPEHKLKALAAMPKLEDIGRRRVANLPAALKMEERRQGAVGLQGMSALRAAAASEHHGVAQEAAIQDAAPAQNQAPSFGQKIASLLPERSLDMGQARMPVQVKQGIESAVTEAPKRHKAKLQTGDSKKGVEIEGPLADRKVVNYEIPEFPQWAKDQGVLEASVAIRFWVDQNGDVLPNMRVEHTSGYGRLDRLAMDSLSRWKFAPLISDERQWGVITFRFLLE